MNARTYSIKNKKKLFAILFTVFLTAEMLTNCTVGELEGEYSLGNDYYIVGNGKNSSLSIKVKNLHGVFQKSVLLGEIVDFDYNQSYIVIFRNGSPRARIYFNLQDSLWNAQRGNDSLQYWIIEKKNKIIWGPLNSKEYLKKRDSLKIPKKIKLKEEE